MAFRRKSRERAEEPAPEEAAAVAGAAAADDEQDSAEPERSGPRDRSEVDDIGGYLDFGGLLMVSPWNHAEGEVYGAQLGLFNSARRMTGVQIGLVNLARRLHGLQIGLINFARHGGVLPASPIVNFGW